MKVGGLGESLGCRKPVNRREIGKNSYLAQVGQGTGDGYNPGAVSTY